MLGAISHRHHSQPFRCSEFSNHRQIPPPPSFTAIQPSEFPRLHHSRPFRRPEFGDSSPPPPPAISRALSERGIGRIANEATVLARELPPHSVRFIYFASKTSGIPCHSFIPAQLFAFAGTWIDFNLLQRSNMLFGASGRSPRIVTLSRSLQ